MSKICVTFKAFFEEGQAKIKPDADKGFNTIDNALRSAKKDSEHGQLIMVYPSSSVEEIFPHAFHCLAFNGQLYIPLTQEEQETLDA